MQFKSLAVVASLLFAFAQGAPAPTEDLVKKAQLEKDADEIWLWKRGELKGKLQKDADEIWLWKN